MFRRTLAFTYGVACYLTFLASFLYLVGFLGNFLVPKSINSGEPGPWGIALAVNTLLVALFGLQHTAMARPSFKRVWTKIVPKAVERSTYVLLTSVALGLIYWLWQPMAATVWSIDAPQARAIMWGLCGLGWLTVLVTTFLINHFDLFGLRQVWLHLLGKECLPLKFTTPGPYRSVRHPLYVGWLTCFWATPTMTASHLLFAAGMTIYILIAIFFEERNLVEHHGEEYAAYRRRTPMLLPRFT